MKNYIKGIILFASLAVLILGGFSSCKQTKSGVTKGGSLIKYSNTSTEDISKKATIFKDMLINLEPVGADAVGKNEILLTDKGYVFTYSNGSTKIEYTVNPKDEKLKNGMLNITSKLNDKKEITATSNGGTRYRTSKMKIIEPEDFAKNGTVKFTHKFDKNKVVLEYTEICEGKTTKKSYNLYIKGMSLIIEVQSESVSYKDGYAGFTTGKATNIKNAKTIDVAYAEDVPVIVVDDSYFLSSYIDKSYTNATSRIATTFASSEKGEAQAGMITKYDKNSAGEVNPIKERMYITISENIDDCLYFTSKEKSKYRDELTDKVVIEEWGGRPFNERNTFYTDLYKKYYMTNVMYIDHPWQRDGYDNSLPAHFPAQESLGGNSELLKVISAMNNTFGWMTSLHEDYWFMTDDDRNQYFKEKGVMDRLCKDANLNPLTGWETSTSTKSYSIKPSEMKYYSDIESKLIKNTFNTSAIYLDVNGAIAPDSINCVTFDASSKTSRSISMSAMENMRFFDGMKKIYDGPFMSEGLGSKDSFVAAYAGYVDAVERELFGGLNGQIMPDYELKYIRTLMANQGMGYQIRASTEADSKSYNWDKYNSMAIAYGHTGFVNNILENGTDEEYINVYYMFQAIQSQYLDTSVTVDIKYINGTDELTLSQAVIKNYNFNESRLHIKYSNGLEIYFNFADDNLEVKANGKTYILDNTGYVAFNNSKNFLQYSCLVDGNRVDFVDCESYTYANGRGVATDFGKFTTATIKLIKKDAKSTKKPLIFDLSAEDSSKVGVVVGLSTTTPCNVTMLYGENALDKTYYESFAFDTDHTIKIIIGLKAGTVYKYKVVAEDIAGNQVVSDIKTFTTGGNKGDELPKLFTPVLNTPFSSVKAFSDIQGDNNWYYYGYNGAAFKELLYNYPKRVWGIAGTWTEIGAALQHPDASDSARAFKAPVGGTISVKYSVSRPGIIDAISDPAKFFVMLGSETIYPTKDISLTIDNTKTYEGTFTVNINKGDMLYFVINRGENNIYDGCGVDFELTYTKMN